MNVAQKIITGIALLAMAVISFGFDPRSATITRNVWKFFSALLAVVFVWGAFYVFFSFIKRKKKEKEPSSEGKT